MLFGLLVLAVTTGAQAGSARLPDNFWLLGNFTQNVRCRGNSSDPAEVKVKVAADQIVSNTCAPVVGDATASLSESAH